MSKYDTYNARVGDRITYDGTTMTVWQVTAAGSAGTAHSAGPKVWAHTRPGGYGVSFDWTGHQRHTIERAAE